MILQTISQYLPTTAAIAIAIFLVNQIIEMRRRNKVRKNNKNLITSLLSAEVSSNYRAFRLNVSVFQQMRDGNYRGKLYVSRTGYESCEISKGGVTISSPLPVLDTSAYDKVVEILAQLDSRLFGYVQDCYAKSMFIKTARKVVASVLEGNAPDIEKEWCKYLVKRALEERQQIADSFREAYKGLTGNELEDSANET